MGFLKRNKSKANADPMLMWLNGQNARDILCPEGYTPLSKNEEIRRCIYKIADLVSNMTIMLMENGSNGDVRIKNELSKKIDVAPCNCMTRKSFIHKLVTDMCLYGNAVVIPKHNTNGWLDNLQICDVEQVRYKADGEHYKLLYKDKVFSDDEVLHFVLNPDDEKPYFGQGFTQLVKRAVENLLQANATKTGFLKSKWKPSLIISIEADTDDLIDPEKREKILGSYAKETEQGAPWIIPGGEIDVKTVQPLTLNDLAIQDSIMLDLKAIACAIGTPPFMVGVGEFKKDEYNNFVSTVIMSIATILQQELTKKLLLSPTMYFKFNPKSLMQYELGEKVEFVKTLVAGGMLNRNEGRSEFDYSPVDDLGMNEYVVLENYIPVADVGKQKKLEKGGDKNG